MNVPATTPEHAAAPARDHLVQFYDDDAFLVDTVVAFLETGLHDSQPLVVIATDRHLASFREGLATRGFDVETLNEDRRLTLLDARDTLSRLMVGRQPDPDRFEQVVGSIIDARLAGRASSAVRAYGEMVDLLWQDGNTDAAIQLERLWNGLARTRGFSLLCAYRLDGFPHAAHGSPFDAVCAEHTHVRPADGYARADTDEARQREIARLQQRARALESELAHRATLERSLREAIEAQRRTQAQLEEAIHARDDFISIASHELRNPVHAIHLQILGALEAARGNAELSASRLVERVGRAHDQVGRLGRLLDNLLDVSRITAGRLDLEIEPVDLAEIVSGVVDRSRDQIGPIDIAADLTPVPGAWDRLRLDQVVTNLLSNAVKYGNGKPIRLAVTRDRDRATLRVADQGDGMDTGQMARLFARFERAVSNRRYGGFGLGLWITRQIVEAMGGSIHVESAVGAGTSFIVQLPLHNDSSTSVSRASMSPSLPAAPPV
jgi:signal transduction histidine kinase